MKTQINIDRKLEDVLDWVNYTLREGQEPPWSWYQFMKLREAIEAIRTGEMVLPMEDLPQLAGHQETDLRPKGHIVQLDNARCHRGKPGSRWPK